MRAALRTEDLTKFYGRRRGIEDLDLEVDSGQIFGFLGPNGAGKTTTIRLLLDLIRPTRGRAEVLGLDAITDSIEIRRRVGYLPGEMALYRRLTGQELLEHFSNLRRFRRPLGHDLAERLDLDLTRPAQALSRGNRQKLGLVQAMMGGPELMILDEPTSGLDPLIQQEFYALVREAVERGATVFLSSHVLTEVERIADRVGIIRGGRLVEQASITDLQQRALRRIEIRFEEPVPLQEFESLDGVRQATAHDNLLRLEVEGSLDPVIKRAAQHTVANVVSQQADLEELFLSYYAEGDADAS